MFSAAPLSDIPANGTVRTSRRRARPASSEGSISQPKAKRQRSTLSEQTFTNPDVSGEMQEVKSAKVAVIAPKRESARLAQLTEKTLTVRGKKHKATERGSGGKDDGSVVLTQNDTYTVSRLPAWPDRLQTDVLGRQHGAIYSDSGYALALTHSQAIVWPYATSSSSLETFTFNLPYPSKHASDPLPLGSLVSSSASSSEPGLVVVMPVSGKVTYWESVASAATLHLMSQQRKGVELTISGILSGETVVQILNAESAGFMLGFSSGRTAYMSVRDGQGRPVISVQFLRGGNGAISSGIFGSLRNALSSTAWRGDLSAMKAGPVSKHGERDVVTATSKGRLQFWNLHRGGHNSLQADVETRESIVGAMKKFNPELVNLSLESLELFDLAFVPKATNAKENENLVDDNFVELLLLVSLSGRGGCHYALVYLTLGPQSADVDRVRYIHSYTTPVNEKSVSKPKLYLPQPAVVAFIVFDRAVVVCSMTIQPESVDAQLRADSHIHPVDFEDVVDFKEDVGIEVAGSGMEEPYTSQHVPEEIRSRRNRTKYPGVVLLLKAGGVIRIAATNPSKFGSAKAPQVTAKSKLEQAIFFGILENNPVSFRGRSEIQFTAEEVGYAAIKLSEEVLSSTTRYIPSLPISVDQNLRRRSQVLRTLASHLKTTKVELDRVTRWRLMWDAEKLASATVAWDRYDALLKQSPDGQKHSLWNDIVDHIHEESKKELVVSAGENDSVRHYFINDLWRLEIAFPWACKIVDHVYKEGDADRKTLLSLVSEAIDLILRPLKAAFDFRSTNLELYGLGAEQLEDGILTTGYEDLPEIWTSTKLIVAASGRLLELAQKIVEEDWQKPQSKGQTDSGAVDKIRLDIVKLMDFSFKSCIERSQWCLVQEDEELVQQGHQFQDHLIEREEQTKGLARIGQVDEAIGLARKYHIFPALVALIIEETERMNQAVDTSTRQAAADSKPLVQRLESLGELIKTLYQVYGRPYADALYTYYANRGEFYALVNRQDVNQQYLTDFLRGNPKYAKVAWIHEVDQEHDFDMAAKELLDLGLRTEQHLWSKKVDLSIGKLARLAGRQYSESDGLLIPDGGRAELSDAKRELALIQIQDKLFSHVHPAISAAIDENAELQLALEVYDNPRLNDKMALSVILQERLCSLLKHKAMSSLDLVDLLTLLGANSRADDQGQPSQVDGQEFYYALQALKLGALYQDDRSMVERVIWRRCMIRDDWEEINNTEFKSDDEVFYRLSRTALYSTLRAGIKNRLFEKPSQYQPVRPQKVLGACTEDLDDRFKGLDTGLKEPILNDMQAEDDTLRHYIDSCQLEKWFEGALDLAKRSVEDEANLAVEEGQIMKNTAAHLLQMEEEIASESRKAALELLRSKSKFQTKPRLNGSIGNFRTSLTAQH